MPQQQLIPKEEEEEEKVGYSLLDEKYNYFKEVQGRNFDVTFGIRRKGINYFIGDKIVDYDGDYIWVGANKFKDTDGLWELITSKNPDTTDVTDSDFVAYEKILRDSNVIFHENNPKKRPRSSGGHKYTKIISSIYKDIIAERGATGEGITIIPSNPNALLERLDLLMASKEAGNTGLRNEIVSICDELKRQGVLKSKSYKNLMSIL